jgi:hypothetical protein
MRKWGGRMVDTNPNNNQIGKDEKIKSGWRKLLKKTVVVTGKGIVKGTKALAETTKRKWDEAAIERQKRRELLALKERFLRRISLSKLKQLCHEKAIPTKVKKTKLAQRRRGGFYTKLYTHTYTYEELIKILKRSATLDEIINFATRHRVNIRDVLIELQREQADKDLQEMIEESKAIDEFYLQVIQAINSFESFRRYDEELAYQIDLARWLQSRFPKTKIEETRGSARPDIVIGGIAVEVKGPTFDRDLQTISDKCMRYCQYYPQGMIVVLFDVYVNQYRYNDWLKGMKNTFPDVMIIKK